VLKLCTRTCLRCNSKPVPFCAHLCAHPVETSGGLWRTVEKRGKLPRRKFRRRSQTGSEHEPALSSHSSITTHGRSPKLSKPATGTCFPLTIPSYGGKLPSPVLAL